MRHPKKFEIADKILDARKDKKCITFCATIKDSEHFKDRGPLLHSKKKKKENQKIIEEFNNGGPSVLSTNKSADAGVDIKGLSVGIILSGDSSSRRFVQRTGRCVRLEEDKVAEMFTLVINNTNDSRWFDNANNGQHYISLNEHDLDIVLNGGEVKINNYDLKKEFKNAIRYVGAIIENPDLYMYLSGYDNLKISAILYGIDSKRINEVVKLVGLEDKIYDKVKKYSLGMRQRLGIAQAILHRPKVLILDEPMNGLDPLGIKELKDLLINLARREKIAILISSHLLSELENICNRVCVISGGRIIRNERIDVIKRVASTNSYILEVSDINLDNILSNYQVVDNSHIKIKADNLRITNILKTLLLNNILVLEMKKEIVSLENIFLEINE